MPENECAKTDRCTQKQEAKLRKADEKAAATKKEVDEQAAYRFCQRMNTSSAAPVQDLEQPRFFQQPTVCGLCSMCDPGDSELSTIYVSRQMARSQSASHSTLTLVFSAD